MCLPCLLYLCLLCLAIGERAKKSAALKDVGNTAKKVKNDAEGYLVKAEYVLKQLKKETFVYDVCFPYIHDGLRNVAHILSSQQEIGTITTLVEKKVIQRVKIDTEEEAEGTTENDKNYAYVKLSKGKLEFVSHRHKETNPGAYIRFRIQETNQKECAKCGPTFGKLFNCEIKMYGTYDILSTELRCEVCARCEEKYCLQNRKEKDSQQKYTLWTKEYSDGGSNIFCSDECVKKNWSICPECNSTVSYLQCTNYNERHHDCYL